MTQIEQPDQPLIHEIAATGAQPGSPRSMADRVQKARQHAADNQTHDMDIPGYNGLLFCRYGLMEFKRLRVISRRIGKTIKDGDEAQIAACCDTLIASCQEFWLRDGDREYPLSEELKESLPVKYDARLAAFCGFALSDAHPARSAVLGLFLNNEIALFAHNQALSLWMTTAGSEADEDGLGE